MKILVVGIIKVFFDEDRGLNIDLPEFDVAHDS